MAADPAAALLAVAADLERRDESVAGEIAVVRDLADRTGAVRARAGEIRVALERMPGELEDVARRRHEAQDEAARARAELELAESRLRGLESGRRRRADEVERARKEATTAREALADANARLDRLDAVEAGLRDEGRALDAEAEMLARAAARVAAEVRALPRVGDAARREPGAMLDELEDWGGHLRSALFVARGTLETERERLVVEANGLGSSVLGETLGASSVAVVRRRLEQHLA